MKRMIIISVAGLFLFLFILFLFFHFFYNRPWHRAFMIDPLDKFNTTEKIVALTFDDGPSNTRTPKLLDVLKKQNVKATFFVLGEKAAGYPEIIKRIHEEGHLIGNHSYNHPRLILKPPGYIRNQIEKTESLLHSLGIPEVQYFRPPYCDKLIVLPLVLKSMNKTLVTCSYDPLLQYSRDFNGGSVADQVIRNITPGDIITLHDGRDDNPDEFIKAVEKIIIQLTNMGYRFVTLEYDQHK